MEQEQAQELINGIQKGLLQWYDFQEGGNALYIGDMASPPAQLLSEKGLKVVCASLEQLSEEERQRENDRTYDYIVCIEALEEQEDPALFLTLFYRLLKSGGTLLLGMNNRMGVRYFCGDKDPYTGRCFDGIEGYKRAYAKKEDTFKGRSYDMAELRALLAAAGWERYRFYSVFPDLKNPSLIYAEDFLPNEDLSNRLIPFFNHPQSAFLDERLLYNDLAENGMLHRMADGYLIECTISGALADVDHVTCSMDRGREKALFTILRPSGIVEKRAAYPEGRERLERLTAHGRDLAAHGICVVDARMENDAYIMPYMEGEVAQLYLKRLIKTDKEAFLREMDRFRDLILQSSDIVREDAGDGEGALLRRGYLDMVPLNSFYTDGEFVFYDQEFCEENYPANAVITRMITTFYCGDPGLNKIIPIEELFDRYNLSGRTEHWRGMEYDFLGKLLNSQALSEYYGKHRPDSGVIHSNRQRINYSEAEYRRIFIDIFKDADTKKLILFGSGNFAKRFLDLYQEDYPVYAVVDNKKESWGETINGVTIQSPAIFNELKPDECKVIICIKNYISVVDQLESLGVAGYSIYDANIGYERRAGQRAAAPDGRGTPKKYRTGYISGVFDLFHVGHLNMFKRAKEQCDYLIVGVVTDEGVRAFKKVEPFVPFEERLELVRSCRYVDEAVGIPLQYNDTREAYKLYRFDCQFSGSDYADRPAWLANQEFLRENGSEMVFFPYTESTSSSKIKMLIEKKLL